MDIRARTLFASFALVALIVLSANALARPALLQGFLFGVPGDPLSAEAIDLHFSVPTQSHGIEYGSQAEVFRFSLEAEEAYTLRYLTVAVRHAGLTLSDRAEDWKLYEVHNGQIDFSAPVGYGESFDDVYLKLRFESTPSVGYWGSKGEDTFALVASVLNGSEGSEPWLTVSAPTLLPDGFDWAFVAGKHSEAWMGVGATYHSAEVSGLPTEEYKRD